MAGERIIPLSPAGSSAVHFSAHHFAFGFARAPRYSRVRRVAPTESVDFRRPIVANDGGIAIYGVLYRCNDLAIVLLPKRLTLKHQALYSGRLITSKSAGIRTGVVGLNFHILHYRIQAFCAFPKATGIQTYHKENLYWSILRNFQGEISEPVLYLSILCQTAISTHEHGHLLNALQREGRRAQGLHGDTHEFHGIVICCHAVG